MDANSIGEGAVGALVVAKAVADWLGGRKKDRRQTNAYSQFTQSHEALNARLGGIEESIADVRADVAEVRAFCVGPDGENGFRSQINDNKLRINGLEERERDRLERNIGILDRRAAV